MAGIDPEIFRQYCYSPTTRSNQLQWASIPNANNQVSDIPPNEPRYINLAESSARDFVITPLKQSNSSVGDPYSIVIPLKKELEDKHHLDATIEQGRFGPGSLQLRMPLSYYRVTETALKSIPNIVLTGIPSNHLSGLMKRCNKMDISTTTYE
jgi:hypothetical protein